jgi:hypothetical protein
MDGFFMNSYLFRHTIIKETTLVFYRCSKDNDGDYKTEKGTLIYMFTCLLERISCQENDEDSR